jgi:hypothetical protein
MAGVIPGRCTSIEPGISRFAATGLFCRGRLRIISANLTPASGRQDRTTSPSAATSPVLRLCRGHRIPHPTFVTIAMGVATEQGRRRAYASSRVRPKRSCQIYPRIQGSRSLGWGVPRYRDRRASLKIPDRIIFLDFILLKRDDGTRTSLKKPHAFLVARR